MRVFRVSAENGFSFVEILVGIAILAIVVPGFFALQRLTLKSNQEARAETVVKTILQSEIEWLRANCADRLDVLLGETPPDDPGDVCANYPRDQDQIDGSNPTFTYRVSLTKLEDNLVLVTVTVSWPRYLGASGIRTFSGALNGDWSGYWE